MISVDFLVTFSADVIDPSFRDGPVVRVDVRFVYKETDKVKQVHDDNELYPFLLWLRVKVLQVRFQLLLQPTKLEEKDHREA